MMYGIDPDQILADDASDSLAMGAIGSMVDASLNDRLNRHGAAFPGGGVVPVGGKATYDVHHQPLVMTGLEWRCIPILWYFSEGCSEVQIKIVGTVTGTLYVALTVGDHVHPTEGYATAAGTTQTLTAHVDPSYRGLVSKIYLWFQGVANTGAGHQETGKLFVREYDNTRSAQWWGIGVGTSNYDFDHRIGFFQNVTAVSVINNPVALAVAGWNDYLLPRTIQLYTDAARTIAAAQPRQAVYVDADGQCYFTPDYDVNVFNGVDADSLITNTTYYWGSYSLGHIDVKAIYIEEITYSGISQDETDYAAGSAPSSAKVLAASNHINTLDRKGVIYSVWPTPDDKRQFGTYVTSTWTMIGGCYAEDLFSGTGLFEVYILCESLKGNRELQVRIGLYDDDGSESDSSDVTIFDLERSQAIEAPARGSFAPTLMEGRLIDDDMHYLVEVHVPIDADLSSGAGGQHVVVLARCLDASPAIYIYSVLIIGRP